MSQKAYWEGFNDAFADGCSRTNGLTPAEAFAYRKGFATGSKARTEADNEDALPEPLVTGNNGPMFDRE